MGLRCSAVTPSTAGAMLTLQHAPIPQETAQGCARSRCPFAEIRVAAWELHAALDSTGHLYSKEGSQKMCWPQGTAGLGTSRGSSRHCPGGALCSSCGWGRGIPHAAAATVLNPDVTSALLLCSMFWCSTTSSCPALVPPMVTDGLLAIIVSVNEGLGRAHAAH